MGTVVRRLGVSCALIAVAAGVAGCSGCGSAGTALTVGAILNQLNGTVNNIVENAGAQGRATTIASAGSVQDAIQNSESAFAADLNKTLDNVNHGVAANIRQLQNIVGE